MRAVVMTRKQANNQDQRSDDSKDTVETTPCPEKNGTNNVLGITLTKFNKFSQFLAQFMLTYQLTKKL